MLDKPIPVPSLITENQKNHLLVRQRIIEAAEGRLTTVVEEFEKSFDILGKYDKTVTVFGSARLKPDNDVYKQAFSVGWILAKHGYAVLTGGGGGVMEAANKGAKEAGGDSIGFNIHLPSEQKLNDYTTDDFRFEHFFGRKVAMTLDASAYVFCGGGFGTLDELFEIVTLVQTGTIPRVPIILVGTKFWKPLNHYIKEIMDEAYHTIEPEDVHLYTITDDMGVVIDKINESTLEKARDEMHERATRINDRWVSEGRK